jgi:Ca2+-binding RTX toxin-like protein
MTSSTGNTHFFNENRPNETVLGTFSNLTQPIGNYVITGSATWIGFYKLFNNNGVLELRVANTSGINREAAFGAIHALTIEAGAGASRDAISLSLNINDVNEAPTGILLRVSGVDGTEVTIDERTAPTDATARLGSLRLTDPDGDTSGYGRPSAIWQIDQSSPFANLFQVEAVTNTTTGITTYHLRQTGTIDYEALTDRGAGQPRWIDLPIVGTDSNGGAGALSITQNLRIIVRDVAETPTNTAPTDIDLSATSIAESAQPGDVIGNLTATDAQGGALTFAVQNDPNNKFAVVNNNGTWQLVLRTGAALDFEGSTSHQVTVRVTDSGDLFRDEVFTINVTNVNEAPTDIALSGTTVNSTAGANTPIGNLTFTDPDANPTGTYSIVTNPNSYFKIANNQLQVNDGVTLAAGNYTVRLRVTDQGGLTREEDFTITVSQGNTAPTITNLPVGAVTISDREAVQVLKDITIQDSGFLNIVVRMDRADKGAFSNLSNGIYNPQEGTYTIAGRTAFEATEMLRALRFDARDKNAGAAAEQTTFTITVTDSENLSTSRTVDVSATAPPAPFLNSAPTGLTLGGTKVVQELAGDGSVVGQLSATDANGDALTYKIKLANGALVDADGRFKIGGNQLLVDNGVRFDFEQATSHAVTVVVSDGRGGSAEQSFTVTVGDVAVERTAGSVFDDIIKSGNLKDNLAGGLGNDAIYAGGGNDVLNGDLGDDKLWGGLGKDTLTGGKGKDIFVFDTFNARTNVRQNLDKVTDFNVRDDSFWLDNKVFKKLGKGTELKPGKLKKDFFALDAAADGNDYVIYQKSTGKLYYDADGSGAAAAVQIASLKKGLRMTEKDFFII